MHFSIAFRISFQRAGKGVARGGQAQFFRGQTPNALAVHGELRRAGGRNDFCQPVLFDDRQHVGGDGLDFRHHEMWPLLLDQRPQRLAVRHVDDMGAMGHLMAGRVGIAIHRDNFHAQALQGDDHFLAQFAAAEQHDPSSRGAERSTDFHDCCLKDFALAA